jgi:hypothetical protein
MMRLRDVTTKKDGTAHKKVERPVKQIKLDQKTGLPMVEGSEESSDDGETLDGDDVKGSSFPLCTLDWLFAADRQETVARHRDESKEEKKARKQAVKAQRSARRTEKKANKTTFDTEKKRQVNIAGRRSAADVSVHNPGRATVTTLSWCNGCPLWYTCFLLDGGSPHATGNLRPARFVLSLVLRDEAGWQEARLLPFV